MTCSGLCYCLKCTRLADFARFGGSGAFWRTRGVFSACSWSWTGDAGEVAGDDGSAVAGAASSNCLANKAACS